MRDHNESGARKGLMGIGGGLLLALAAWFAITGVPATTEASPDSDPIAIARGLNEAFTSVSEEVIPSVVTVTSNKVIRTAGGWPHGGNEQFDEFFGRFFGTPDGEGGGEIRQRALGSGVIISPDGYIVTNNHVVANAEDVAVILSDGEEYEAEIIGTDSKTDVAVIKIDGERLPFANLGDSEKIRVGEWVLAIGSPFSRELGATVTAGIVSGTGRGLGLANYENFIQTDAAINPGNSGGALVNLNGEVIGISTAIASRSGGSQGVGFAIPINMVTRIKDDLIDYGKVTRGWIGIAIQPISKEFQEALDLPNRSGVLISGVEEGSPADEAGLKQRDVIRYLNGVEVENFRSFRMEVASTEPGTDIRLGIHRDGRERTVDLVLGTFPDENDEPVRSGKDSGELLGIKTADISTELRRKFDLDRREGVVVTSVRRGSVAAENNIRPGDVILEVNQTEISNMREYRDAIGDLEEGAVALLLIERADSTFFVALRGRE